MLILPYTLQAEDGGFVGLEPGAILYPITPNKESLDTFSVGTPYVGSNPKRTGMYVNKSFYFDQLNKYSYDFKDITKKDINVALKKSKLPNLSADNVIFISVKKNQVLMALKSHVFSPVNTQNVLKRKHYQSVTNTICADIQVSNMPEKIPLEKITKKKEKVKPKKGKKVSLTNYDKCTKNNSYLEAQLKDFFQTKSDFDRSYPPLCTAVALKHNSGENNERMNYRVCNRDKRVPHGNPPPCYSKTYHKVVHSTYAGLANCLGVDPKEMAATLFNESGFHVNAKSQSGARGMGQISRIWANEVNNKYFSKYRNQLLNKGGNCKKLAEQMGSKKLNPNSECDGYTLPKNPALSLMYSMINNIEYKKEINELISPTDSKKLDNLSPEAKEFQKKLNASPDKDKIINELITYAYNHGITATTSRIEMFRISPEVKAKRIFGYSDFSRLYVNFLKTNNLKLLANLCPGFHKAKKELDKNPNASVKNTRCKNRGNSTIGTLLKRYYEELNYLRLEYPEKSGSSTSVSGGGKTLNSNVNSLLASKGKRTKAGICSNY